MVVDRGGKRGGWDRGYENVEIFGTFGADLRSHVGLRLARCEKEFLFGKYDVVLLGELPD